jgi:hypothetical protein
MFEKRIKRKANERKLNLDILCRFKFIKEIEIQEKRYVSLQATKRNYKKENIKSKIIGITETLKLLTAEFSHEYLAPVKQSDGSCVILLGFPSHLAFSIQDFIVGTPLSQ